MANKIKIYGDIDSASIFFLNSTVDPKPLGTVVASLKDDEDRIVVQRSDRFRADGITFRTLFRRLNPSRVCNRQGEELVDQLGYSTQDVIDYINAQANLTGVTGGDSSGTDLTDLDVCFKLDDTSTSIMLDNGYSFGVNTIKAVDESGLISIKSELGDLTHFTNLDHTKVCGQDGNAVSGGLNDVINYLNELFTVGAFESVVISDPYSTMIADIDGLVDSGSLVGSAVVDPIGNDIGGNTTTNNNNAGYLSSETINQAGEYFTFDIRGEGQIGFGLVHTQDSYDDGYYSGNSTYANPANFCVGANSSHYGYQFSHFFHPTPNGSWTNYGANTNYSMRSGWGNFNGTDEQADWLAGNPIKMRVGLDTNGYISIETLRDGSTWEVHSRTSYSAPEGAEFKLGIKFSNPYARLYSTPKVHLLEEAAPTMYFRYIESPDGVFNYPLFATEEEANYYDSENGGSGTSHIHVYADDPTNTSWYMPDTNGVMNGTSAPSSDLSLGQSAAYTEITSLTNADQIPPAFTDTSITINELSTINYQLSPVDVGYVTTVGNAYGWTVVNGTTLTGTAPEVTGDNVANPSDTTTVTVYRTNSYGTSQGTLTVNITNLTAPVVTAITGVTDEGGTSLIDSDTLADGSVVSIDNVINVGNRFTFDKEWVDNYVLPKITAGTGAKSVFIGFPSSSANWSSVEVGDFLLGYQFYSDDTTRAANNWKLRVLLNGSIQYNVGVGGQTSGLYDYALINDGTDINLGALVASQGLNISSYVYNFSGVDSTWKYTAGLSGVSSSSKDIFIATNGTDMDLDLQYFAEYTEPVASTNQTNWTKALDFSGSSEHLKQVSSSFYANSMRMNHLGYSVPSNADSSKTTNDSYARPWACSVVFKPDFNNSNQHIWNLGEGTGANDDNIYLRLSASRELYFGWGAGNSNNECLISSYLPNNYWFGVYIGHKGYRPGSDAAATASNLAIGFDIRFKSSGDWDYESGNLSSVANWTSGSTGTRMNRSVTGDFTIGGRGSNRNFHGKVASMVITTLKTNTTMPSNAEIKLMITDPKKWEQDYLVGKTIRQIHTTSNVTYSKTNLYNGYGAVQIWLMGDGTSDSYANGIRNEVYPSEQNYSKLQLNSMVSNDIQNVSINGLT